MNYLLHHLLEASARAHPHDPAVVDGSRVVSYGELDSRANQLANLLHDAGVSRGERIGIYLDKSVESLVAIYAALKVGGVYVPFDPQAPAARLGYIASDCATRCVLSGVEKAGRWRAVVQAGAPIETLVVLNAAGGDARLERADLPREPRLLSREAIDAQPTTRPPTRSIGLDLAYVLYTSGSTGRPKGVMLTHRNGLAFVEWAVDELAVRREDRLSSHAPLHFDLSIFDIFAAAGAGAALVLVPRSTAMFPVELLRFVERERISVWYSVPSALSMLVEKGTLAVGDLPHLRAVLFAGEVFPTKYLRRLMGLLPRARFCNLYGPTETNVCTWYDVPPLPEDQSEPIPIGRAIGDVEVLAVTEDGKAARPGEVGELYVRGPTVMSGYWGDAERTSRSLVANPFDTALEDRLYRTGDLVREDEDGNFRFLGRRDAQIKSRGYRIELGEVEAALYANPRVVECAVVAIPDELVTNRLVAFVVTDRDVSANDVVRFCAERLPGYMIPEQIEFRGALPKTSTGKIDRQRLARESSGRPGAEGVRVSA